MEWALPLIAVTVLAFAAVSRRLDGTSITAPMVFTAAGLAFGAMAAGLNVESGLNDGICVPIFAIALAVASAEAGLSGAHRAFTLVVEELGYGALVGAGAGAAAAAIVVLAGRHRLAEPIWLRIVPAAAAAFAFT